MGYGLRSYHRAAALGGSGYDLLLSVLHGAHCSSRRLSDATKRVTVAKNVRQKTGRAPTRMSAEQRNGKEFFATLARCLVLHYSSSCTLIAQQQGLHLTTELECVVTLWCRCGSCDKGSPSCSSDQAGTCQGKA